MVNCSTVNGWCFNLPKGELFGVSVCLVVNCPTVNYLGFLFVCWWTGWGFCLSSGEQPDGELSGVSVCPVVNSLMVNCLRFLFAQWQWWTVCPVVNCPLVVFLLLLSVWWWTAQWWIVWGFFVCPVVNCSTVNCLVYLLASGELSGGKMPTGELSKGEMPCTHLLLGLPLLHGPVQPMLQHNLNCPEHEWIPVFWRAMPVLLTTTTSSRGHHRDGLLM